MPVRSLRSSVLRWPDREEVDRAVRRWAERVATRPEVQAVGYFGSYARDAWGVGSDVDLVIVLGDAREPFHRRGLEYDTLDLPVPADLFVYTAQEWSGDSTLETSREERIGPIVWVYRRS
jgi:predicted nucleotidyltransferase